MNAPLHSAWHAIVRHAAFAALPDRDTAAAWLEDPRPSLGGLSPLAAANSRTGTELVLQQIDTIRAGRCDDILPA